jgi:hypothetical protein
MLYRAVAQNGYSPEDKDEISFPKGAILDVLEYKGDDKGLVRDPFTGCTGAVPLSLLSRIDTYDALEEGWRNFYSDHKHSEVPVLGFIICDYCGESDKELSVFHYDIVQILRQTDPEWIYVRLQIPKDERILEGLIPRSCVQVQQVSLEKCKSHPITIEFA